MDIGKTRVAIRLYYVLELYSLNVGGSSVDAIGRVCAITYRERVPSQLHFDLL